MLIVAAISTVWVKAGEALDKANRLHAEGESLAEIDSAAYVAQRRAETARALAGRCRRNMQEGVGAIVR